MKQQYKYIYFLLTLTCTVCIAQAQKIKHKSSSAAHMAWLDKHHKDSYDDCVYHNKLTLQQRLKHYPFLKATKILAVSYHNSEAGPKSEQDTIKFGLIIHKDTLDYSTFVEVKTLTKAQIAKLTNIIYNTDYRVKIDFRTITQGTCFVPRNAVVFLDGNGKVIDYLSVCFACRNYSSKSERLTIGSVCNQKYDLLKKYFIGLGIKTGTITD